MFQLQTTRFASTAWRNCAARWKSTQHSLFSISAVRLRLVYLVATATNVSCLEHRKSIPVRWREGYKWHAKNQLDAEIVIPWRLVFSISFISITNNHVLALDRPQNRWWWRKTTHRIAPLQHNARRDLSWWFVYKLQPRFDVVLSQPQRFMPQTTRSLMKRWVLWGVCQSSFTFGWSNFLHFFGYSPFSLLIKTHHHKATVLIHCVHSSPSHAHGVESMCLCD